MNFMTQIVKPIPAWLLLLSVAMLILGTDEFVISGILADVAADFGVSPGQAGLLVTAFALAFCIGSPIVAVLTDPLDKKRVLIGGLILFAIANGLMAIANLFWLAIILRIIAGVSAAAVSPTIMAIAGTHAPLGNQGRYLSVVTAGLTIALFTGVPLGSWVGHAWGWKATFLMIALLSILITLFSVWLTAPVPGNEPTPLLVRLSPIRNWQVLSLVLAMLLCGAGGLAFYNYLGATIEVYLGSDASHVTWTLLLVGIIGIFAVFGGGALTDLSGARIARLIVIGGHAIALLGLGLFLLAGGKFGIWFLVLVSIWSLFAWSLGPAMQASIIAIDPKHAMLLAALGISGLYGGAGIGAAIGGLLFDHLGASAVALSGFIFLSGAWLFAARRERGLPQ